MIKDKNNPDIKIDDVIEGFKVKKIDELPVLSNIMYQLEHQKTGAKMIHLSNEDDNNCFSVAFKTTPQDSTGVAHILEHTALCGSKEFPVRDPFFSMIRRSMKTFMNAFTSSDWTMYPFSTQNEKDFFNLMSVYLDAAFFPLLNEHSFKQEGHRLEYAGESPADSPLTVQGVVYNEMKGAMSSQSSVMHDCTGRSLFPTITYKYNSGGDPEEITNLTHQQLIDFHQTHYHPSNSYFFTYGCFPLRQNLEFINKHALSKFEKIEVTTTVPNEQRFNEPKSFSYSYPLNKQDDDGRKCQVALAWLTCRIDQPLDVLSLQLVNLILLGHSGAPLRKSLIESGLGKSLADTTGFEDEIKEPFFSVGLQGVAESDVDKVEELILKTLNQIVENGISQDQIESAIHQIEMDTREISGGHYPYSLNLLFRFFGNWIHGGNPIDAIDFDNTLNKLWSELESGDFLKKQIKKYFIDNKHRVKIVLKPDLDLEVKRESELKTKLETLDAGLSEEEKSEIINEAVILKKLQEEKEDLSILPTLKVNDIPKKIKYVDPVKEGLTDFDITFFDRPTNGIAYFNWYFDIDQFPDNEKKWLPLLGYLLVNTGAGDLSYEKMAEQVSQYTGGFSASPSIETRLGQSIDHKEYFVVTSKALNRNLANLFSLSALIMGERNFDETGHIRNLIAQRTNNFVNSIVQVGHNYAASLANRSMSRSSQIEEIYSGVHQIQFMKMLAGQSTEELEQSILQMKQLLGLILNPDKLSMLVIGDKSALSCSEPLIEEFYSQFQQAPSSHKNRIQSNTSSGTAEQNSAQKEAWVTTTPVSYVAKAFKTIDYTHEDSPKLYVMSNLLKSCYLHGEIREKGGAYGAMTSYNTDEGIFNMLSYRDPNLEKTLAAYKQAFNWLESDQFTDNDVEETILQTCSNMDTPMSPAGKAVVEHVLKRKGKTKEQREAFRAGVLNTRKDDVIEVAQKHLLKSSTSIAAVTSQAIVDREKESSQDSFRVSEI